MVDDISDGNDDDDSLVKENNKQEQTEGVSLSLVL